MIEELLLITKKLKLINVIKNVQKWIWKCSTQIVLNNKKKSWITILVVWIQIV